jgi:Family of unknown function (DUF5819)
MYKRTGVQQRLESSVAGRAAISVFLIVTLVSLIVWNLPDSEIQRKSLKFVRPYITALSLEQNWGVFAPDPRRQTIDFFARVRYDDGSEEVVRMPTGGSVVGAYWDYHWWKWVESVISDKRDALWKPAAVWFARRATTDTRRPVKVMLVRRWYDLYPPGPGPSHGDWNEKTYYTLTVTPPVENGG